MIWCIQFPALFALEKNPNPPIFSPSLPTKQKTPTGLLIHTHANPSIKYPCILSRPGSIEVKHNIKQIPTRSSFCFHLKNAISTHWVVKYQILVKNSYPYYPIPIHPYNPFLLRSLQKRWIPNNPINHVNKFRGRQKTMIKKVTFGSLPIPDQPTRRRDEVFLIDCCARKMSERGTRRRWWWLRGRPSHSCRSSWSWSLMDHL